MITFISAIVTIKVCTSFPLCYNYSPHPLLRSCCSGVAQSEAHSGPTWAELHTSLSGGRGTLSWSKVCSSPHWKSQTWASLAPLFQPVWSSVWCYLLVQPYCGHHILPTASWFHSEMYSKQHDCQPSWRGNLQVQHVEYQDHYSPLINSVLRGILEHCCSFHLTTLQPYTRSFTFVHGNLRVQSRSSYLHGWFTCSSCCKWRIMLIKNQVELCMPCFRGRKHFQGGATQNMSPFGAQLAQDAWKLIVAYHFPLQLLHFRSEQLIMIIWDMYIFSLILPYCVSGMCYIK